LADLLKTLDFQASKDDLGSWDEVKKLESDYLNLLKGMPLQEVTLDTMEPVPKS
jgi:hypothetical protein